MIWLQATLYFFEVMLLETLALALAKNEEDDKEDSTFSQD